MNTGHFWTQAEEAQLLAEYKRFPPYLSVREFCQDYAKRSGLSEPSVRVRLTRLIKPISESPYPRYHEPLVMEGDALILPDIEFPFHHAEFLNKCLELAAAWNIRQCICAGDLLHFDSLSGWEPNWKEPDKGGLTQTAETQLMEFARRLPKTRQGEMMELLGNIGQKPEHDGMSTESSVARRELRRMEKQFDKIDFVIGNHEGRLLRALQTTLDTAELKRLLECGDKWRIAPYYFSYLVSGGEKYLIDHPKSAAASTAAVLAAKYRCSVLMAHSHHFSITTDVSGNYFAAEIGCIVDEARLPYSAQRHTRAPAHSLGAAVVRNGYPTILTRFTDWDRLQ